MENIDAISKKERPLDICELLRGALTDKINDRDIFVKGIEQSWSYEEEDSHKGN